jgi:hypothetical protein
VTSPGRRFPGRRFPGRLPALLGPLALLLFFSPLPGAAPTPRAEAAAPAEDPDGATREWDQYGGNAARTFAADVEPVRATPRVAWRGEAGVRDAGELVASEGTLFATTTAYDGTSSLRAISLADGKILARHDLGKNGEAFAVVSRGMVVTGDLKGLRGWQLQGRSFTLRWTAKAPLMVPPALLGGKVLAHSLSRVTAYDPLTGKAGESAGLSTECAPAFDPLRGLDGMAGATTGGLKGYVGTHAFLTLPGERHVAMFAERTVGPEGYVVSRLANEDPARSGWFVVTRRALAAVGGEAFSAVVPDRKAADDGGLLNPVALPATVRKGNAVGFTRKGELVQVQGDGMFLVIVHAGELPPGAAPGPATRARNVAYFGNWAVDLDTRRVLWCLKDLKLKTVLPVADRFLVGVDEGGGLVGLTDRPEGAGSAGDEAAAAGAEAPALPAPSGKDGLLLADGTEVPGAVEALPGGKWRVAPASGSPREEPAERVLLAQAGGKVLLRGPESAILERWRRTLHPAARDALVALHGTFVKSGLHEAAAALVAEARAFGLPEDRAAELGRKAAAARPHPKPARRIVELEPEIAKVRAPVRDSLRGAAEWCRARGLPGAAACLLGDAARWSPRDGDVPALAEDCVPAGFPWAGSPGAGARWIDWAREVVPADGSFVPADHVLRRSITTGPWAGTEGLVVLRTPNVILRSRCVDPVVAGRCLRNAEGTVRALVSLFGPSAVIPVRDDHDLMDVRLHAREEDYRTEEVHGGYPMPWSAGYYSPDEGVSRFFVPGAGSRDPLGRGLAEVLVHELTHHFVEQRWTEARGRRAPGIRTPGYWCVEGFARFVEDQVVEMDRRGLRFDDRTVPSLEAAAQADAQGVLFPPSSLLDMSAADFDRLPTKAAIKVRLRNTLETRLLSPLSLFYEQSGAAVYHLLNERGSEGRGAFLRYLADYYRGAPPSPAWKALGFASAAECDREFRQFLAGLR